MANASTSSRSSLNAGDLVVCHNAKGFHSGTFGARVLADADMHRPAQDGMVWVRETGLGVTGEAWVTEWRRDWIS